MDLCRGKDTVCPPPPAVSPPYVTPTWEVRSRHRVSIREGKRETERGFISLPVRRKPW